MKIEIVIGIATGVLAFTLAIGGGVAWVLNIQGDVNEKLRADSVWKAVAESEHDETRRYICHWQQDSHLYCPP